MNLRTYDFFDFGKSRIMDYLAATGRNRSKKVFEEDNASSDTTTETKTPIAQYSEVLPVPQVSNLLEKLDELYINCSAENWDGYEANPISPDAYFEAKKLLHSLPYVFPMPDILPEPEGEIGLEWYRERGFSFAISVSGQNKIIYAGQFGKNNEIHGSEDFSGSIPMIVFYALKRLYSKENESGK